MANRAANTALTVALADAAAQREHVVLGLGADDLPRLSALVAQSETDAVGGSPVAPEMRATFDFEPHTAPAFVAVDVHVEGACALPCQRCLELVRVDVDIDTRLAVGEGLDDEMLEGLEVACERWDHEGETLALAEVVDELVMLDLPLVVMHEPRDACGALAGRLAGDAGQAGTQRPFAGLQALLTDKDN